MDNVAVGEGEQLSYMESQLVYNFWSALKYVSVS